MRHYKTLIQVLTVTIITGLPLSGSTDGFFDQYDLDCPASTDVSTFEFMQQPWLSPDEQKSVDEFLSSIADIESQQGAYSAALIPLLAGLGHTYRQNGNHDAAAEAYQRALEILKINEGLYSTNQVPLLDILIEENSVIDNWEKVSNHYRYMYWLYRRNFDAKDPRLLPGLKRIRQWEINSYNKDTGKSLDDQFRIANEIRDQIIDILLSCTDDQRIAYCYLYSGCCPEAGEGGYCPVKE